MTTSINVTENVTNVSVGATQGLPGAPGAAGIGLYEACRLATTANITLSGEQTIDGVLTAASRVLVKNQTNSAENGIYVSGAGAWIRSTDLNSATQFELGKMVTIYAGTTNANTLWMLSTVPTVLGTDPVVWSDVGSAGSGDPDQNIYETFSVDAGDLLLTPSSPTETLDFAGTAGILTTGNQALDRVVFSAVPAEIDHDLLLNYVPNEHIDHSTVSVTGGTGLSGGGTIDGNQIIVVDIASLTQVAPAATDEAVISTTGGIIRKADLGPIANLADHDVLTNYVATQHVNHSSVSITGGDGLSGGGDITASRTIDVDIAGTTDLAGPERADQVLVSDTSNLDAIRKSDLGALVDLADHDALLNFVANEHIDHTSVVISAGAGLEGGGNIAANRSFNIANNGVSAAMLADMDVDHLRMRVTAGTGDPEDVKISEVTEELAPAAGDFVLIELAEGNLRKADIGNLPGGGGSTQNLFETFAPDSGGNIVADSPTDTLTVTGGQGMTTVGTPATDTISVDMDVNNMTAGVITDADKIPFYDDDAAAHRAETFADLRAIVHATYAGLRTAAQLVATANVALTGEQTIDGVLTSASRILLVGQTAQAENGLYVTAAGAWSRAVDMDTDAETLLGTKVTVLEGDENAKTAWVMTTAPATLGTNPMVWESQESLLASVKIDIEAGTEVSHLLDAYDRFWRSGKLAGGAVTDNANGTFDIASGTAMYRKTNTESGALTQNTFPASAAVAPTDNDVTLVYSKYNGGTPNTLTTLDASNTSPAFDFDAVLLALVYRAGTVLTVIETGSISNDVSDIEKRLLFAEGLVRQANTAIVSETGTRNIAIAAGEFWLAAQNISTSAYDSSGADDFTYWYSDGVGGFTSVTAQSQISSTQYDDGDGTLGNLTAGNYGNSWVYGIIGSNGDLDVHVRYGTVDAETETDALNEPEPSRPPILDGGGGILLARCTVLQGASSISRIDNFFGGVVTSGAASQPAWTTIQGDSGSTSPTTPNQTLTLAGGAGLTSTVTPNTATLDIDNAGVTRAMLANMDTDHIMLRNTAGSGAPEDVKVSELPEELTPTSGDFILGETAGGDLVRMDVGNLPTGGGGESNSGANVGVGGVGPFKDKTGITLNFKSIHTEGGTVLIRDDTTNDNIDIDVLSVYQACRVVSTTDLDLTGEETIDGILTSTDRVLVAGQTTASANGIYLSGAGAWTRVADLDDTAEVLLGGLVSVLEGTVYANSVWQMSTAPATLGTNDLNWTLCARDGNVSAVGTPSNNQVAFWDGARTIEGDTDFTWDPSGRILVLESDGTGTTAAPTLHLARRDGTPNPDDYMGQVVYSDGLSLQNYARTTAQIVSSTSSAEIGRFAIETTTGGTDYLDRYLFQEGNVDIVKQEDGAANPVAVKMFKDSATPADNDEIATLCYCARDSANNEDIFAQILGKAPVVTSGSEEGSLDFRLQDGTGSLTTVVTMNAPGAFAIRESGSLSFAGATILDDLAGVTTLANIDAIDATTEATFEAAIDSLSNLTVVGTLVTGNADAIVSAASTTAQGKIEIATAAEVSTGTDATRAISPDAFAGSDFGKAKTSTQVTDGSAALTVGDGKAYIRILEEMNNMELVGVNVAVTAPSTAGTIDVQIARGRQSTPTTAHAFVDMLSTKCTIDANEYDSKDAATAPVINTTNDDVEEGDLIRIDLDAIGSGPTAVLTVTLSFAIP